jgi:hypothetical protein
MKVVSWTVARCPSAWVKVKCLGAVVTGEGSKEEVSKADSVGRDRSRLEPKEMGATEQSVSKDRQYLSVGGAWGVVGGWWLSEAGSKVVGGWMEEEEEDVGAGKGKGREGRGRTETDAWRPALSAFQAGDRPRKPQSGFK